MNLETISLNGTIDDVASFFRVSPRTVQQWQTDKVIGFWKEGRNVVFGQEDVIERKAAGHVAARRMEPGEAREMARREWREHLELRRSMEERFAKIEDRVAQLETLLQRKEAA